MPKLSRIVLPTDPPIPRSAPKTPARRLPTGQLVTDQADKPVKARYTPEDRQLAVSLLATGKSFREVARELPFSCSLHTLHTWVTDAELANGNNSSQERRRAKGERLRWMFLLAAEHHLAESMEMSAAGDGKSAMNATIAAGTALDKALILDGQAPVAKFGRMSAQMQANTPSDAATDAHAALLEAANTQPDHT